jgi:hypothetical protein
MDVDEGSLTDHLADSTDNVTLIREEVCLPTGLPLIGAHELWSECSL